MLNYIFVLVQKSRAKWGYFPSLHIRELFLDQFIHFQRKNSWNHEPVDV